MAGPTIPVFIIKRWDPFFYWRRRRPISPSLSRSQSRSFLLACSLRCHTRRSNVSNARFHEGRTTRPSPNLGLGFVNVAAGEEGAVSRGNSAENKYADRSGRTVDFMTQRTRNVRKAWEFSGPERRKGSRRRRFAIPRDRRGREGTGGTRRVWAGHASRLESATRKTNACIAKLLHRDARRARKSHRVSTYRTKSRSDAFNCATTE